jgi:hypothetical protein
MTIREWVVPVTYRHEEDYIDDVAFARTLIGYASRLNLPASVKNT